MKYDETIEAIILQVWTINQKYMDVSENSGTPKSSILIGLSIKNHPFWGTPIFGNIHIFLAGPLEYGPPSCQTL